MREMKIGNININNIASLAPMAGVTDRAFREICSKFGVAYFTSEMVSVKGLIYESKKTFSLIEHGDDEKPFALQLFGNNPKDFYEAVKLLSDNLPDIIDINMGCPAPKIVKENSGSALMKTPELCGEIVRSVKQACSLPVTVKIRAGWNSSNMNAPEVARICSQAGADAITVHGRTKEQGYSGNNNLDIIKKVKESVSIPVIGNGDVVSVESAKRMLEHTNCDLIAIGRGSMGNPWIFSQINSWYKNGSFQEDIPAHEKSSVIKEHIEKMCKYKGESTGIKEARKHMAAYIRGIPHAAELRKRVFVAENKSQLMEICDSLI